MYCVKCGVKLGEAEKQCPLCQTKVYHPDFEPVAGEPMYPENKMPKGSSGPWVRNGIIIVLFLIPFLLCLYADMSLDKHLQWFGYVAGGLVVAYVTVALPLWFRKPNPVVFVPCDFAAVAGYLFYINYVTGGNWFFSFALPLTVGLCLIVTTVVTLLRYLRRGGLFIFGGAFMGLGAFTVLVEFLLGITFGFAFIGWSIYPLVVLALFGGLLMYFAINSSAREMLERKLFF